MAVLSRLSPLSVVTPALYLTQYRFSNAKTRLLVDLRGEARRRAASRPAPEAEGAPRRRTRQRQV